MIRNLPTFKGYTVDMRLQEFRKIKSNRLPEFIPFSSKLGKWLLSSFAATSQGKEVIDNYLTYQP